MSRAIWKKRFRPLAQYDADEELWFVDDDEAFSNDLFQEMPDMFSSDDLEDVAEEWDLPMHIIECIYEKVLHKNMN